MKRKDCVDVSYKAFDKHLDSSYEGDVEILGVWYPISSILKAVDPLRYDLIYQDWSYDLKPVSDDPKAY